MDIVSQEIYIYLPVFFYDGVAEVVKPGAQEWHLKVIDRFEADFGLIWRYPETLD